MSANNISDEGRNREESIRTDLLSRRKALRKAFAGAIIGIAGCASNGQPQDGETATERPPTETETENMGEETTPTPTEQQETEQTEEPQANEEPTSGEFYVLPDGAGDRDGSDWDNALPARDAESIINNSLEPGDTLYLGSGEYNLQLELDTSGTEAEPIVITGSDRGGGYPVFAESTDDPTGSTRPGIRIAGDVSNLQLKQLEIESFLFGITTTDNDISENIHLEDITISEVLTGIRLENVRNSTISGCEITYHSKRGIRFETGCRDIEVVDCFTDHNPDDREWPNEWPMGMSIETGSEPGDNRDITFRRCEARNCRETDEDYWNGDGFLIDDAHPNIEFYDCIASGNADGGWDDKGDGTYYENCISANNKRNFRVWENSTLENCLSVNAHVSGGTGTAAGLTNVGEVELINCTFYNNDTGTVMGELQSAENCIFATRDPNPQSGTGNVFPDDPDPDFNSPDEDYIGHPRDAYNSQEYGPSVGFWIDIENS